MDIKKILDMLRSGEELPTVFVYTSIYGVGNSFDHVHFHACVMVLNATVLTADQTVRGLQGELRCGPLQLCQTKLTDMSLVD